MKIFFNPIAFNVKEATKNTNCIKQKSNNTLNTTSLSNFPNYNYQINFGANNDNLETFYKAYSNGNGMPESYNMHLNTYTAEEREKITEVFANYRSFYQNMENCHTVEELKSSYPKEFQKLKSAFSVEARGNSFLNKFNDLALSHANEGVYIFPETQDNDLTVYLAKKIYLESKTKAEIDKDFYNDLNKEFYTVEDYKAEFPQDDAGAIPQNIYKDLGLTTNRSATGFRHSLCCSRDDYIQKYDSVYKGKRKETFNKFIDDVLSVKKTENTTNRSVPKNSANYEKYKYAMFLAWNNSVELRKALSDYLFTQRHGNELLRPDFMEINSSKQQEQVSMREIMRGFWFRNPELREEFSTNCQKAFDDVEHAIDTGKFEEFKKEIEENRQQIYEELATNKAAREEELRLRKLEQEKEQELIDKKKAVRSATIEQLHLIDKVYPIPKNLFGATINKIQENLPEVTHEITYDDIKNVRDNSLHNLRRQISIALCDTFFDFFDNINYIKNNKNLKENILNFISSTKKEIIKTQENLANDSTLLNFVFRQELSEVGKLFISDVLHPYCVLLIKDKTKDMSYANRKKIITAIYNAAIKTREYTETCQINTQVRTNIYKELTNILCEIPTSDLLNRYTVNYKTQIIDTDPRKINLFSSQ